MKLYKSSVSTNLGKFSFKNRIIDEWNHLPEHVISCKTVNKFKNELDKHFRFCRGFI